MEQIRGFSWWWGVRGCFHCKQDCGNAFAVAAGAVEEGRHVFIFSYSLSRSFFAWLLNS